MKKNIFNLTELVTCSTDSGFIVKAEKLQETLETNSNTNLPDICEFEMIDIETDAVEKVLNLLSENYKTNNFKIIYTKEFLNWSMSRDKLCLGIQIKDTKKLFGVILGSVSCYQTNNNLIRTIEINYACLHKKMRTKGFFPKLVEQFVKETIKKYNGEINTCFYTTPRETKNAFVKSKTYCRPINFKKLYDEKFVTVSSNENIKELTKYYKVKHNLDNSFSKLHRGDIGTLHELYKVYSEKYNFHPVHTIDEFTRLYLYGIENDILKVYVIKEDEKIVDFISFYLLKYQMNNSTVMINSGNLFYYTSNVTNIYTIIRNTLTIAASCGVDIFNASNVMENEQILTDFKFSETDKENDNYYCFGNWKCPTLELSQICKIIV